MSCFGGVGPAGNNSYSSHTTALQARMHISVHGDSYMCLLDANYVLMGAVFVHRAALG